MTNRMLWDGKDVTAALKMTIDACIDTVGQLSDVSVTTHSRSGSSLPSLPPRRLRLRLQGVLRPKSCRAAFSSDRLLRFAHFVTNLSPSHICSQIT